MQRRGGELGVTPFGVAGTVNQTSHLRPSYCAGAHVARFNGYVNRAFRKIFSAKIVCRRSNGLHFCVCRNIVQGFRHVVCATNDPVFANYHCSHRNFVLVGCKLGFGNGKPHVFFVIVCFHVANIQQKGENPKNAAADSNIVKRVEVNGLWYDLNPDKTAEVTANPNINYEGDVIICSKATDDEENEYTVTSIGDYAFAGQIGMNSITIPETVEKLGSGVFEECTGLTKIICESATPPSAISETVKPQVIVFRAARQSGVDGTFNDWCFENVELYVPKGSIDAYKSAEPWRKFKKIVESVPTGISVVPADEMGIQISGNKVYANGKQMQVYDVTGGIVYEGNASVTLQRGIYIIKAGGRSLKIKM